MITDRELQDLLEYAPRTAAPVLTVYLNVNQGYAPNLNRGFEVTLHNVLREIEEGLGREQRAAFRADADRCRDFVKRYAPEGRTLVYVCSSVNDFEWSGCLRLPLDSQAHWGARPYVRPLFEAREEHERYGVILTDRGQARLFIVALGEIEEHAETLAQGDVKRCDASAKDQILSQMQNQRKADEHARWHLKRVAELMDDLRRRKQFNHLILAGPADATSELNRLLSGEMRERVIGTAAAIALNASEKEILATTAPLIDEYERRNAQDRVQRLLTAARKNNHAVLGLPPTLHAAAERRVLSLMYAEGYQADGGECTHCGALTTEAAGACAQCGGMVEAADNLIERLIEQIAREGGTVAHVRDSAAEELSRSADGIGAVLRF